MKNILRRFRNFIDNIFKKRSSTKEVLAAKAVLKENGFYVENLWHIDDVDLFEIDECFEVLSDAIEQDSIYEQINASIQDSVENIYKFRNR